jgi:hypothetical protein
LAHAESFLGHLSVSFSAQAGGPDVGNGGTYSASLERNLSGVAVHLTKQKLRGRRGFVIFSGRAAGGALSIKDSFADTGADWHGTEERTGPLLKHLPDYASVLLYAYPKSCLYQVQLVFGVGTTFSGNVPNPDPHPEITGSEFSADEPLTKSLHLSGDQDPEVYWGGGCPKPKPGEEGVYACSGFGGGEIGLCGTSDVQAADCGGAGDDQMHKTKSNDLKTNFSWHLSPKFS